MRQLCKQFNATYTTKLEKELLGSTNDEICTKVVERLKLPIAADELLAKLRILASKHLPHAPLMKGAEKLLYHLHKNKVPFALVTNATKTAVSLHEKVRPELFSLFNHKVCWHDPDVKRPKPFPDPYLIGAKRFNVKPEMCLAFEDTIVGTKAALAANMQVVMIPCTKKAIKGSACATLVLQSLLEFKPEIFGLPPFK